MDGQGMTYRDSGVDYKAMDPFKRMCQQAAVTTAGNLAQYGLSELTASRGESAYLIEFPDFYLGHVEEGLGTKNLVADAVALLTGRTHYNQVGQCNAAMAFNDLVTLGALPFSFALHLAVANGGWFENELRCRDLVAGCVEACNQAGAVWGAGETPTLKGIIVPGAAEMNCSAIGIIRPKSLLIDPVNLRPGDRIVLLASSGVHANGLTLCRKIAEKLPDGYVTKLSDGTPYGEALLAPTVIYAEVIRALQDARVSIHYTVNITGHGWRKLMRAKQPFAYVVEEVPEPQPIFRFIQEQGPVDDKEAYGNLNMGAGFAVYVASQDAERTIEIAQLCGIQAWDCGYLEASQESSVHIKPKDVNWTAKDLEVR